MEKIIMKTRNRSTWLIACLVLLMAAFAGGCDSLNGGDAAVLQASGVVEAVDVVISPEVGGKVAEVWVVEGSQVRSGDPLFRLEDKILESSLDQAEAALAVAQANYDLIAAGSTLEQRDANIALAELEMANAEFALDALYDPNFALLAAEARQAMDEAQDALDDLQNSDLQQALALKAIADAQKNVEDMNRRLNTTRSTASQADIDAASAQVVLAKDVLDKAKDDFEPYENKPESNLMRAHFQAQLANAQQIYDAAVRRLNALESTGRETDIEVAGANLTAAQAALSDAYRDWEDVKDGPNPYDVALLEAQITYYEEEWQKLLAGPDPDDVHLAEVRVENAQAQLALARASSPTPEQLSIAAAQVEVAQANLRAIQLQIVSLIVSAPINGVVVVRNVEPGEIITPGGFAMTISQLDSLRVTVYIPEDRYGQINLDDHASLTADSFPDEIFDAVVTRIADRAEYTPRNVQTEEERKTTVFAVELVVMETAGQLKPGMPVDVVFIGQ